MKKRIVWSFVVCGAFAAGWYLLSPLFITKEVNETFPAPPAAGDTPPATAAPASATAVLASGEFGDVDIIHKGVGTVSVHRLADGSRVLRLEDFEVTNGPGLHLILSPHPQPRTQSEVKQTGYVDLGELKGNKGNQNYVIPDTVSLEDIRSAVIYCYPFNVVFSTATFE